MLKRIGLYGALLVLVLCLAPAAASAQTYSFINTDVLDPTQGAGTVGPVGTFPSVVPVTGVAGTVTKVRLTVFGFSSASGADADLLLVGPNGQSVLLMSDACGKTSVAPGGADNGFRNNTWTFDDSAPTLLPSGGPCPQYQSASYKPSGYVGDDAATGGADLSQFGGPAPPYGSALSSLAGGSANGDWKLYAADDDPACCDGLHLNGWAVTLDVQPPSSSGNTPTGGKHHTGKRARAIKKCKKKYKHRRKARRRCIKRANKLPR